MRSIEVRSQKSEVKQQRSPDDLGTKRQSTPRSSSSFILHPSSLRSSGFSLIELLVVIGIIAILMGLLFPVIGRVRTSAYNSKSQQIISSLTAAIEHYYQDFRAYPGPLSNDQIYASTAYPVAANRVWNQPGGAGGAVLSRVTMTENLVLGLSGGLQYNTRFEFDPTLVGRGPKVLATVGTKTNQQLSPYIDGIPMSATGVKFTDSSGIVADDSIIPEYVDAFSEPMPILYLRARTGSDGIIFNNVPNTPAYATAVQYDLNQIYGYTVNNIGSGQAHGLRSVVVGSTFTSPPYTDAYPYFVDPTSAAANPQPRRKDAYILISAGTDRIYGTDDDITNFGTVR